MELQHLSCHANKKIDFRMFTDLVIRMCKAAERPIVLMIDEVDQASSAQVFTAFLGCLRDMYLKRPGRPTFQSVILAGVHDIKNMKHKFRPEDEHTTLVSRICKFIDERIFENGELQMLKEILFRGRLAEYIPGDIGMRIAVMFGFAKLKDGTLCISNRIFETRLYNGFLAEESHNNEIPQIASYEKNLFITNGKLDMDLVISKFVQHYTELFREHNEKFLENNGRSIFLLFIRPIINGTGNYYIEAQTRNNRRTDLIIDFAGQQFIVELKIYRGQEYHKRGEDQLIDCLETYHARKGYLVCFNFNKKKEIGVKRLVFGDKVIIEAVV